MITRTRRRASRPARPGGLDQRALIGTMAGTVQTWVNLLAFVLQTFLVSRIFKYIGVARRAVRPAADRARRLRG